jgi:phosphoglycerate dehydrogenase-like enzyme
MPERRRVVIAFRLAPAHVERIRQVSQRLDVVQVPEQEDALAAALGDAEVALMSPDELAMPPDAVPKLRWVQSPYAGMGRFFSYPLADTDLIVTNASGVHAIPIGEYVLGSMLAFSRHFPELLRRQGRGEWVDSQELQCCLVGSELRDRTLGVMGYGAIGREVARLAQAFGMRVLALKRNPGERHDPHWHPAETGDPEGRIPERFYDVSERDEFLAQCDYVALSMPLTPETGGIIDERALRSMRHNAYLVNIGRGRLIDETALIRALREGWIAGAGLDVASIEPLPAESELFRLANVILTPHNSPITHRYDDRVTDLFIDNLRMYLEGRPLWNVVDKERGY